MAHHRCSLHEECTEKNCDHWKCHEPRGRCDQNEATCSSLAKRCRCLPEPVEERREERPPHLNEDEEIICDHRETCKNESCDHAKPHKVIKQSYVRRDEKRTEGTCLDEINCDRSGAGWRRCVPVRAFFPSGNSVRVNLEVWVREKQTEQALETLRKALEQTARNESLTTLHQVVTRR
jgi:hypothetical protein